jgi:pimeloyl-ACP methyl ester carboxylesterase
MSGCTSNYLLCEGREIHYTEWGAQHADVVVAWHGLARTGRDMDAIAEALSHRWRVICPDTLGRGLSQWSPDPRAEYCLAFYEKLALSLLDQLGVAHCLWLGTSMGGAIGLKAAAGDLRGRIRRLVLNDIGPQLAAPAVQRIRAYAGSPPAFATMGELEAFFRTVYAPYGWLPDAQWRQLTETSMRRLPDGRVTPHYDPAMVQQFECHPDDYVLWNEWDTLELPVLCLRGESSDLLLPETADAMRARGPRAVVVTIPGCGHAPALNTPAQFALVERFFGGS